MSIHHHIVDTIRPAAGTPEPLVLAIGNLDGVHLGHQALLKTTRALADAHGHRAAVLTFTPHPREYFNPSLKPLALMRPASKIKALHALGIQRVIFAKFDHALAGMEAEAFIEGFCVATLGAHHIVTGENFYFGKARRGNVQLLEKTMRGLHLGYSCVEGVYDAGSNGLKEGRSVDRPSHERGGAAVSCESTQESCPSGQQAFTETNKKIISSSRVRQVLSGGNVAAASELLGRPFTLEGRVGHGEKRGRTIGFPTANIPMHNLYLPAFGVYAVRTQIDGAWQHGVANLGLRPTFGGQSPRLEVHLLDWQGDLYGKRLEIELLHYIRPEQKFDGLEALKTQITEDIRIATSLLASV